METLGLLLSGVAVQAVSAPVYDGGYTVEKQVALSMRGITKRFGSVVANHSVDLDVYEGEILAILGENGCGKSTLLSIIAGMLPPEEGTILVNNPDGSLQYPRIGYMLQHDHLLE